MAMKNGKKILHRAAIAFVVVALFFAALGVMTTFVVNTAAVKEKVRTVVSRELGGKAAYERIDVSLFPRPQVTVEKLRLSYPRTFRGTLGSISLRLQVLPLFRGKVYLAKIRILEPDFRVILPAPSAADPAGEAPTLEEVRDNIRSVLGFLHAYAPGLDVEMDRGKFTFRRQRRTFLALDNVSVRFNTPPGDIRLLVSAATDTWGDFSLRGAYRFDEAQTEVSGLSVSLGRSSLKDLSVALTWGKDPRLYIKSGSAVYDLRQIYHWLQSSESLTPFLKELSSIRGRLIITSLRGEGPPLDPEQWRMRMTGEFENIEMESPRLPVPVTVNSRFAVEDNLAEVSDFSARFGSSTVTRVFASVAGRTNPRLDVRQGNASIDITQLYGWRDWHPALENALKGVDDVAGRFKLTSLAITGPLEQPETWKIHAAGVLDHVFVRAPIFPGPVGLLKGDFRYAPGTLSFGLEHATVLDSTLTGSAIVTGIPVTLNSIDVYLNGSTGRKTLDWAFEKFRLPPSLMTKTPLSLTDSRLVWTKTDGARFRGTAAVANGPSFSVDLSQQAADLNVRRLVIKDRETDAVLTLLWQNQAADFSLSGSLAQGSLGRIFEQGDFGGGILQGELRALVRTDQPLRSRVKGRLSGKNLLVPWGPFAPVTVDGLALHAEGDVLTLDNADVTWGKNHYALNGAVTTSDEGLAFSMALKADGIDIQAIQQALEKSAGESGVQPEKEKGEEKEKARTRSFPMPPIRGDFSAESAYIKFGRFTFAPTHSIITLEPDRVLLELTRAKTCGIALAGAVLVSRESLSFTFTPSAKQEPLGPTIDCLTGKDLHITGDYDFSATIQSQGTMTGLIPAMEGRVDFKARKGKIYQYPTLAKVLSVLSVFEIFRGRAPELGGNGLPYNSMALRGDIHQGVFTIEKAYIGTKSIDILAEGEVDLVNRKIDVVVLVAPFSGINWLIRHTPIINTIMGGTLISIPTRVSGDLTNPDVVPLSPTAVGSRFIKMFENIIKAPVELVAPLFSDKDKEKKGKK